MVVGLETTLKLWIWEIPIAHFYWVFVVCKYTTSSSQALPEAGHNITPLHKWESRLSEGLEDGAGTKPRESGSRTHGLKFSLLCTLPPGWLLQGLHEFCSQWLRYTAGVGHNLVSSPPSGSWDLTHAPSSWGAEEYIAGPWLMEGGYGWNSHRALKRGPHSTNNAHQMQRGNLEQYHNVGWHELYCQRWLTRLKFTRSLGMIFFPWD